jgi:hypothetical protein
MRVPACGGLWMRRPPSSASMRSARPRRPDPRAGSAPPMPSSVITTRAVVLVSVTLTVALSACACFAMFVSVSATT